MTQLLETNFRSPNTNLMLSDALDMLRRVPELRRCTLSIGHSLIFTSPGTPVVVPKLQKLFIYMEPDQLDLFFQAVISPRLERLTIINRQALQSFLVRANHPIKELEFVRIRDMSDDDLLTAFSLSVHLQTSNVPSQSEHCHLLLSMIPNHICVLDSTSWSPLAILRSMHW
ncbi:hypothetical protein PILCRDRAFT_817908 [Piloderma croceum F 1598]|uniref:Uncharacterized protein n=1 Tax=Piloderma croceum (strain F 1598) TaxID=765440 RepID=A0A0C3BFJ3_PILCF|nr:hypothetical protein PILCRDRAFT_817908 [Piloderma croceum F 1598]